MNDLTELTPCIDIIINQVYKSDSLKKKKRRAIISYTFTSATLFGDGGYEELRRDYGDIKSVVEQ